MYVCTDYYEGKFFPVHTMKAYMGNRGIAPLILNYGTSWRKGPRYPMNGRLGGPQSRSGNFRGEKSLLILTEFEPQAVQLLLKIVMFAIYCNLHRRALEEV